MYVCACVTRSCEIHCVHVYAQNKRMRTYLHFNGRMLPYVHVNVRVFTYVHASMDRHGQRCMSPPREPSSFIQWRMHAYNRQTCTRQWTDMDRHARINGQTWTDMHASIDRHGQTCARQRTDMDRHACLHKSNLESSAFINGA